MVGGALAGRQAVRRRDKSTMKLGMKMEATQGATRPDTLDPSLGYRNPSPRPKVINKNSPALFRHCEEHGDEAIYLRRR
jgi:hypothetical protein